MAASKVVGACELGFLAVAFDAHELFHVSLGSFVSSAARRLGLVRLTGLIGWIRTLIGCPIITSSITLHILLLLIILFTFSLGVGL